MRDRARAVVIGGGVGGCSILYWLARLGWDDVVLVERAELTSGSTFHSAGLVGQLRSSLSLTKMMMSSVDLYRSLEEEVGLETGWREVGSLRLASSEERMEEIARQAGWAKTFGLPLELVSPAEAQDLFPPMSTDGVLGAAYLPTDGYIDPSQLTLALAEGYIEVKSFGPIPVKGLAEPVDVYEITGAGAAKTRLQAARMRGLTRFVGRGTELEQLRRAAEQVRGGHGIPLTDEDVHRRVGESHGEARAAQRHDGVDQATGKLARLFNAAGDHKQVGQILALDRSLMDVTNVLEDGQ